MATSQTASAIASGNLVDLVSSSTQATIYPTLETILQVLQARFRADLPYTNVGDRNLVVVNPWKVLGNLSDASRQQYAERGYLNSNTAESAESSKPLQPHIYELAAKVYFALKRSGASQVVLARGPTSSGKSQSLNLLTSQLLYLSSHERQLSAKEKALHKQLQAIPTLLNAFTQAKSSANPTASKASSLLELHYTDTLQGAKLLLWNLSKQPLTYLKTDTRSYNVFYFFLSGATSSERDSYALDDASSYALLASSGTYRLPAGSGPWSDDAAGMSELRTALKSLGFKPRHTASIFSLLIAILTLSNVRFDEDTASTEGGSVVSPYSANALSQSARLLGVQEDELSWVLTNRTCYVRKEMFTVFLSPREATKQRDGFCRDLYALMVAWLVEGVNARIAPPPTRDGRSTRTISVLDLPGFQALPNAADRSSTLSSSGPLVNLSPAASIDDLLANFSAECLHHAVAKHLFADDTGFNALLAQDGVEDVPEVRIPDADPTLELLVGSSSNANLSLIGTSAEKEKGLLGYVGKAAGAWKKKGGATNNGFHGGAAAEAERGDEELASGLVNQFAPGQGQQGAGRGSAFVVDAPGRQASRTSFTVRHFTLAPIGSSGMPAEVTYSTEELAERDADVLDPAWIGLGRGSTEAFIQKLFSGPALGMEMHSRDPGVGVRAQVRSVFLRDPAGVSEDVVPLPTSKTYPLTLQSRWSLGAVFGALERATQAPRWIVTCVAPNTSGSANSFGRSVVRAQVAQAALADVVKRKSIEYVIDYEKEEFCQRYVPRMQGTLEERIRQCARSNGWREIDDFKVGLRSIWLSAAAWKVVEDLLRAQETGSAYPPTLQTSTNMNYDYPDANEEDEDLVPPHLKSRSLSMMGAGGNYWGDSDLDLTLQKGRGGQRVTPGDEGSVFRDPGTPRTPGYDEGDEYKSPSVRNAPAGYGNLPYQGGAGGGDGGQGAASKEGMVVKDAPNAVEEVPSSRSRRWWLAIVWLMTWWIPSFLMRSVGRMKRPDIRLAWREKVAIVGLIFFLNATILFYVIVFGRLLCPNFDKAWTQDEVAQHTGDDDWWAAVQGEVYDLSNFVKANHASAGNADSSAPDTLDQMAGKDLTPYFPVPLALGCDPLVGDQSLRLQIKNGSLKSVPQADHTSGPLALYPTTGLKQDDWYKTTFQPKMKDFHKGPLVWDKKVISGWAADEQIQKIWAVYKSRLYDLTDLVYTQSNNPNEDKFNFLDKDIVTLFKERPGQDITKALDSQLAGMDANARGQNLFCLNNVFSVGETDFRFTARCQTQNYFLLIAAAILMASMGLKFLAALQLGPKRNPEMQDKFVLCQVPCYTEGEESLRRTIDSLAALNYDDKRKLIFIICDGNIVGSGNDRTTPRIALDILGVDPKLDPEPLLFKSIGEGSKALNYGKVYSGLYEFEGHVVPYMVVVKVGKPTERSKPGNRGKRDSQILLMHYLNRVHFDAPMSPLELEIYHQMRNVIGIDPAFYEFIFTVDADTSVTPEAVNRLIASCADDSRIIGICGETKLDNEEGSWWTMIQVYEYYISHHLSKAFESLFGSVTCLPGCFSIYRIRTADKGRPIIISNRIIDEYSEPNVDTLHKKNLFSLGEDRFLTTLLMKHFPTFKTKFNPDAIAHTIAPDKWKVLFSQRRRWINSTVHNLCELVLLPELFGFCCFSMRFFVFIDLLGTLMLPSTVIYLFYLIINVALGKQAVPIIALIMIAVTYGLQALIFIIKREFMLVGWLVVYLISYPVYSFFLPVYSFWCMDEFGWGNTRLVIGEGKEKKVLMNEDEKFDDSMIPLKKFSEYEAEAWETGTRRSDETGYESKYGNGSKYSRRPPASSRDHSPHTYQNASQAGDYYRDTNAMSRDRHAGGSQLSHSNMSQHELHQQPQMSQWGSMAQLPFMPFGGGPGSVHGSDYGHGPMQMPAMTYQSNGSMYGMMPPSMPFMNPMGTGSFTGSQSGNFGGMQPPAGPGGSSLARPMSTFSMATTANPFAGPSENANPTDEELFSALRNYLSTQDLMTVTKKTAREAIMARFPKADLTSRKDFLNQSIDTILSES